MYSKFYKFNGTTLEVSHKDTQTEKCDISIGSNIFVPDPNEVRTTYFFNPAAVERQTTREKRVMENGFKVIKELSYVNIQNIAAMSEDFRIFRQYNKEMENAIQESIKANGLFSPIIVWETVKDNYVVISGLERLKAYHAIYDEAEKINDIEAMKKYELIPSFVLGVNEITEYNAKHIYLDANLCSRVIEGEARVKAYSQYYMILKHFKEKRNEFNIHNELAKQFRVSKQTIYNYLNLNKLIEPLMYLFQEKVINFKSALKLSKYKQTIQESILNTIGLENITNAKINCLKEDCKSEKEFLINLKTAVDCEYPYWSFLKLKLPTKFIEKFAPAIQKLVRQNAKYFVKVIFPKIRV